MNRKIGVAVVALAVTALLSGPAVTANAVDTGYAMVKGTILKSSGNPLTNTNITVGIGDCQSADGCGEDSVVTVKTDSGGHYHARVLVTGNPNVYVGVPPKGPYQGRASAYIKIASGKTYTKNLTVQKQTMFVGKVVDANGYPTAAVLRAYSAKNNSFEDSDVVTSDGYFHLVLAEGAYKIKVSVDSAGGKVVSSWFGSKSKDDATIVRMKPDEDQRAEIVFTP